MHTRVQPPPSGIQRCSISNATVSQRSSSCCTHALYTRSRQESLLASHTMPAGQLTQAGSKPPSDRRSFCIPAARITASYAVAAQVHRAAAAASSPFHAAAAHAHVSTLCRFRTSRSALARRRRPQAFLSYSQVRQPFRAPHVSTHCTCLRAPPAAQQHRTSTALQLHCV